MEECVLVGGAMYSMGIHYVIARALCNNPEAFAERSNNSNSSDADFQYLVDCCVKDKGRGKQCVRKRQDLLAELRGEREEHDAEQTTKRKKKEKPAW